MIYSGIRILVLNGFNGCFTSVPWWLKLAIVIKYFLFTVVACLLG
jgi:hypothetical protein